MQQSGKSGITAPPNAMQPVNSRSNYAACFLLDRVALRDVLAKPEMLEIKTMFASQ